MKDRHKYYKDKSKYYNDYFLFLFFLFFYFHSPFVRKNTQLIINVLSYDYDRKSKFNQSRSKDSLNLLFCLPTSSSSVITDINVVVMKVSYSSNNSTKLLSTSGFRQRRKGEVLIGNLTKSIPQFR